MCVQLFCRSYAQWVEDHTPPTSTLPKQTLKANACSYCSVRTTLWRQQMMWFHCFFMDVHWWLIDCVKSATNGSCHDLLVTICLLCSVVCTQGTTPDERKWTAIQLGTWTCLYVCMYPFVCACDSFSPGDSNSKKKSRWCSSWLPQCKHQTRQDQRHLRVHRMSF